KIARQSDVSFLSIVPVAFTMMVWGTVAMMGTGAAKAFAILSGLESIRAARSRAFAVLKFGVGSFVLAVIVQFGIQLFRYGLGPELLDATRAVGFRSRSPLKETQGISEFRRQWNACGAFPHWPR